MSPDMYRINEFGVGEIVLRMSSLSLVSFRTKVIVIFRHGYLSIYLGYVISLMDFWIVGVCQISTHASFKSGTLGSLDWFSN